MDAKALTSKEQWKSFKLPEGFMIELVSSEKLGAVKPISIAFDDKGRLWTQTARAYPADKRGDLFQQKNGPDQILYFPNPTSRKPQKPKIFAEGLTMPTGVLPYNDNIYVVHGPKIEVFKDTDGDGKADERKTLISGFGIQDTHTGVHQLVRSPGKWINFSQGCLAVGKITLANGTQKPFNRSVFARIKPDGNQVEVIGAGMNNAWAWAQDREGRVYIHEANDLGYSQIAFERDSTYPSFISSKRYSDSFMYPPAAKGLGLGGTGFCGIAVSDDRSRGFPKQWQGVNFVANPITGAINTVKVNYAPDGSYTLEKKENLLSSNDQMFRPVAVEFGPDGCLYVIDWYNRIISHNEVSNDHPARDKVSGRIWRIRHKSQKAYKALDMTKVPTKKLYKHLLSGNTWETRAAWHQIVDRNAVSLIPTLKNMIVSPKTKNDIKIHALWCLEGLNHFDPKLWHKLLRSKNVNLRHEAVRSMSTLQPPMATAHKLLSKLKEKQYYVLNEIARFYRDTPQTIKDNHIKFLNSLRVPDEKMKNDQMTEGKVTAYALGGSYEPRFLNFLIEKAIKQDKGQEGFDESKWNQYVVHAPKNSAADKKVLHQKIKSYTKFARQNQGDLTKGKATFEGRCAICHDPAKGKSAFAPPLNGGKNRDAEGIISSVLDPGAAVEAVFNTYRVTKNDGSSVDGFRTKIDDKAITLTFMGGGELVIPMSEVKSAGYIKNQSVMPAMGADLTEQDMADLVEYIQTIE